MDNGRNGFFEGRGKKDIGEMGKKAWRRRIIVESRMQKSSPSP
jgi:hypothetical protein